MTIKNHTLARLDESLLSHCAPFVGLSKPQLRSILDQASSHRYAEGEEVFFEKGKASRFFFLLDGYIRAVHITAEGEQVTSLHVPAGQLFGIARALGRDTYPATAIAASEALVLSWPMSLWDVFAQQFPGFSATSHKTVGARVGEMNTRIVEMATQHVEQRVANAVLRLMNQSGKQTPTGIEINFPITRQDISELTGTTLHTVSRLLSAWEKAGVVSSKRKKIIVCDAHALVRLSDPTHGD
jgi:CRP-like cAMP-binding protein